MRKLYFSVSLAMTAGLFESCSSDLAETDEIIPQETVDSSLDGTTRTFPENDGALPLRGNPENNFWKILQGADDAFARRRPVS